MSDSDSESYYSSDEGDDSSAEVDRPGKHHDRYDEGSSGASLASGDENESRGQDYSEEGSESRGSYDGDSRGSYGGDSDGSYGSRESYDGDSRGSYRSQGSRSSYQSDDNRDVDVYSEEEASSEGKVSDSDRSREDEDDPGSDEDSRASSEGKVSFSDRSRGDEGDPGSDEDSRARSEDEVSDSDRSRGDEVDPGSDGDSRASSEGEVSDSDKSRGGEGDPGSDEDSRASSEGEVSDSDRSQGDEHGPGSDEDSRASSEGEVSDSDRSKGDEDDPGSDEDSRVERDPGSSEGEVSDLDRSSGGFGKSNLSSAVSDSGDDESQPASEADLNTPIEEEEEKEPSPSKSEASEMLGSDATSVEETTTKVAEEKPDSESEDGVEGEHDDQDISDSDDEEASKSSAADTAPSVGESATKIVEEKPDSESEDGVEGEHNDQDISDSDDEEASRSSAGGTTPPSVGESTANVAEEKPDSESEDGVEGEYDDQDISDSEKNDSAASGGFGARKSKGLSVVSGTTPSCGEPNTEVKDKRLVDSEEKNSASEVDSLVNHHDKEKPEYTNKEASNKESITINEGTVIDQTSDQESSEEGESSDESEDESEKKAPKKKTKSKHSMEESTDEDSSDEDESSDESSDEETKEKKKPQKDKSKKQSTKDDDSSDEESLSEEAMSCNSSTESSKKKSKVSSKATGKTPEGRDARRGSVNRRSGNVLDFYDIQDLLEKGALVNIYAAKNKETGALRAAKEMRKSKENEANNKLVLNEFEVLTKLDHPNLIKTYELFENEEYYFVITDICKGGTLRDELMNSGLYSEARASAFMKQLLACIGYLHKRSFCHRDLKPGNILLEEGNTDRIRVIDFGMATRCGDGDTLSEPTGTPAYMAPEVLGMAYGRESDIWSCGCILFLMLSGQQAFKGKTTEDTFTNIVTGQYSFAAPAWQKISDDAKNFIKLLLTWDAKSGARPTAAQALQHPWIVNNDPSPSSTKPRARAVDTTKDITKDVVEDTDAHSLLKLATCTFMASQLLTKKDKKKLGEIFRAIDTDNGGKLHKAEARIGYQAVLGRDLMDEEMDSIVRNVDPGGTGVLKYSQFILGALFAKDVLSRESLMKVFQIFYDGDNVEKSISVEEMKDLLELVFSLEKKAVKKLLTDFTKDGNDRISFDVFLTMAGVQITVQSHTSESNEAIKPVKEKLESAMSEGKGNKSNKDDSALGSNASLTRSLDSFLEDPDTTESENDEDEGTMGSQSSGLSIKLSATQFVSHRLGALTDHYEVIDYIAKGTYGVVCSALHKETGTTRAIKELKKSKKNKAKNDLLLKEFHILKSLDHPNIIQMHELFEDKRHYYIVTGVSEGGDLHREIKRRGSFEEQDAAILIKQILICLNYCHKNHVVHRDLKPGNILLEGHKNLNHIKIIDFGEAVVSPAEERLTEVAGTMAYMAPEVLGMSYGHKCDVWSCGVIAFIVLTGRQPLRGSSDQETFNNIVKANISYDDPIWDSLSSESQDFVKLLLNWEETLRPTAEEALQHPWIQQQARRQTSLALRQDTMNALSNLEAFDARSKLRVATCTFIATQLMDKEEKEKIDDVFRAIDLNMDGTLNRDEVKQGYEKYFDRELSNEEISLIFKHVDADGTGELEYSEFLFGALDKQNLLSTANLEKAFSIFAGDTGNFTVGELKLLLKDSLTQDELVDDRAINKLMKQIDLNGKGHISFEDFVNMALGSPKGSASSPRGAEEKRTGTFKDENKESDSIKDEPSVDDLDISETPTGGDRNEAPMDLIRDDSSRHLQKAIARASQQQSKFRSNRDPPTYRPGCTDPPSEAERQKALKKKEPRSADPEPSPPKATNQQRATAPSPRMQLSFSRDRQTAETPRNRRRQSPRDAKLEEACEGFDKVQDKIARLRILLSAQDTDSKRSQPRGDRRSRDRKCSPKMETLDSAFAKLSQIQSKMRALQALVKSNQI